MYYIIEEASEALVAIHNNLYETIKDSESRNGKYLIVDDEGNELHDTEPGISYKF